MISNDTMNGLGQRLIKQLKNRYADDAIHKKFIVGIDKSRMKFFNLDNSVNDDIHTDEVDPKKERLDISKQHGSEAYKSGYQIKRFGSKQKKKFEDINMGNEYDG